MLLILLLIVTSAHVLAFDVDGFLQKAESTVIGGLKAAKTIISDSIKNTKTAIENGMKVAQTFVDGGIKATESLVGSEKKYVEVDSVHNKNEKYILVNGVQSAMYNDNQAAQLVVLRKVSLWDKVLEFIHTGGDCDDGDKTQSKTSISDDETKDDKVVMNVEKFTKNDGSNDAEAVVPVDEIPIRNVIKVNNKILTDPTLNPNNMTNDAKINDQNSNTSPKMTTDNGKKIKLADENIRQPTLDETKTVADVLKPEKDVSIKEMEQKNNDVPQSSLILSKLSEMINQIKYVNVINNNTDQSIMANINKKPLAKNKTAITKKPKLKLSKNGIDKKSSKKTDKKKTA